MRPLLDCSALQTRCLSICRTLSADVDDEIEMLRSARTLKKIHSQLTLAAWDQAQLGRHEEAVRARLVLDTMEQHLRRVLLEYSTMRRPQIRECLTRAATASLDAIGLLGVRPAAAADPILQASSSELRGL